MSSLIVSWLWRKINRKLIAYLGYMRQHNFLTHAFSILSRSLLLFKANRYFLFVCNKLSWFIDCTHLTIIVSHNYSYTNSFVSIAGEFAESYLFIAQSTWFAIFKRFREAKWLEIIKMKHSQSLKQKQNFVRGKIRRSKSFHWKFSRTRIIATYFSTWRLSVSHKWLPEKSSLSANRL